MSIQYLLESLEKPRYILISGIVVKDLVIQTPEPMAVHNEQYTKRTVIQFISGDVAGKVSQGIIKVSGLDGAFSFFPPLPRPSSES